MITKLHNNMCATNNRLQYFQENKTAKINKQLCNSILAYSFLELLSYFYDKLDILYYSVSQKRSKDNVKNLLQR